MSRVARPVIKAYQASSFVALVVMLPNNRLHVLALEALAAVLSFQCDVVDIEILLMDVDTPPLSRTQGKVVGRLVRAINSVTAPAPTRSRLPAQIYCP